MLLYWSADDQTFLVEAPDLPGYMAAGASQLEALSNARGIIPEWPETATALNRPIPAPRRQLLLVA